ncbi:hypothetical protein [Acidisphaera sp. L21]|uniref:hypothetical protein n=1 Tax=Acidisphaera sp. L21 TaxID=1641851 RepID=UPI00131E69F3|nr:hypothetical protein [Acidisphaera sp. L21]
MADDRREALLVANRLSQLAESPIRGGFDLSHLQAVYAHIFQDLPHHRPGELRGDPPGWSKFRALGNQVSVHEVHYAHDNIGPRADAMLRDLGEPTGIASLPPEAVPARLARLYGDLDFVHSFHEKTAGRFGSLRARWPMRPTTNSIGHRPMSRPPSAIAFTWPATSPFSNVPFRA